VVVGRLFDPEEKDKGAGVVNHGCRMASSARILLADGYTRKEEIRSRIIDE